MPVQVLSRTQRNDIFQLIRSAGLEPGDFTWATDTSETEPKEILAHPPTEAFMEFSGWSDGGLWLHWWPQHGKSRAFEGVHNWHEGTQFVRVWLSAVKADHDVPDLCGRDRKQKVIPTAAERSEYQEPFAPDELKQLSTALDEIQRFILSAEPLDDLQRQAVEKRFVYLHEAAESGARKIDWLNIFVGQMVALVVAGVLDARVYGPLMSHAATVMNAIFQFGMKLLN